MKGAKRFTNSQDIGLVRGLRTRLWPLILFLLVAPPTRSETFSFADCLAGCPAGAIANNDLIVRSIYTLSFNNETRIADWVAYRVTAGSIGVATNLSREPQEDPFVTETLSQQEFSQIQTESNFERHYFAPLVSFAGTPYWRDTNYLTNMVPRDSNLNRGPWYGLEWAVRNFANRTDAVYVVTGPIFDPGKSKKVQSALLQKSVPSGFYKIVATKNGQIAAFIFDQDVPFSIHHCDQITTLSEIERQTGLDFFPQTTNWPTGDLQSALGCF